jgi:hypothetical protein
MEYDFSQLNDKEFERIVCDLLSLHFKVKIERFKPGKDKGIDGRFFSAQGEVVIQCKHYLKTGYSKLIATLKTNEKPKIDVLKPQKYYFATSLPLSRLNKCEIKKIFFPFTKTERDIWGQEDLNDLLGSFPEIEKKHYKLWLASTNILENIFNQAILGRSSFQNERIKEISNKFVQTEAYSKAVERLHKQNVVILTGEPGIGKTTLAENLCLEYFALGFELVFIENSLSEAESIYQTGKKQVFYFDDFLGSNYLAAIQYKMDSQIVNFIERIKHDKLKKFILTSRTNIFSQGVISSPIFYTRKIQSSELLLQISSLTLYEKAKILYNHIWFSKLPESYIDEIYEDKRYKGIIEHKNFSPRLVEFITDIDRIEKIPPKEYWSYISSSFSNPKDIWDNCFKFQSDQFVRNLVVLTVFNGGEIFETEIRQSFDKLNSIQNLHAIGPADKGFNSVAPLATKSFLVRNRENCSFSYHLFNPSISDYVLKEYDREPEKVFNVFSALNTVKSVINLANLVSQNLIAFPCDGFERLFKDSILTGKNFEYKIEVAKHLAKMPEYRTNIIDVLKDGIRDPEVITNNETFFDLLEEFWLELETHDVAFLNKYLENGFSSETEINSLVKLLENHNLDYDCIGNSLSEKISDYVYSEVAGLADGEDWSGFSSYERGYDGPDLSIDEDGIFEKLVSIGKAVLDGFGSPIVDSLQIPVDDLISEMGISDIVSKIDHSGDYYEDEERGWYSSNFDNIDDLFERE